MDRSKNIIYKILALSFLLRFILILISNSHPDIYNHLDWGNRFLILGPKNFYNNSVWGVSWANQPYGSMTLFAILAFINKSIFSLLWWLNTHFSIFPSFIIPIVEAKLHIWLVKLPFIIFDILIGWLIYSIVKKIRPKSAIFATCLFLFNPIVFYNSAVWGQTDSLINFLSLFGLYLTYQKNYFWGILIFSLSYIFKLSLIIYLPLFFLILITDIHNFKKILLSISFSIFLIIAGGWFFSTYSNPISWLIHMYIDLVLNRQGSMLSGNAFNLWSVIKGFDFTIHEDISIFGVKAKLIGQITTIALIFPIYLKLITHKINLKNILINCFLISFTTFLFLTNMHERYLYPLFPVLSILIGIKTNIISTKGYILLSILHLINLYNLWYYPHIYNMQNILELNQFLIPRLLSILLIFICFRYYYKYFKIKYEAL